jgi:hypothetical protein
MRARWLARRLLPILQERIAIVRLPDFQVIREDRDVYLRRWWVIPRNNYFNVYLHHMIGSDDDVLHDHMYVSVSLVLTDGLRERFNSRPRRITHDEKVRVLQEGQIVWRSSMMAHQLIVDKPAWTLFVTGPRIKEWGFYCRKGFRHWREYVGAGQNPDGSGTGGTGRGCGELS